MAKVGVELVAFLENFFTKRNRSQAYAWQWLPAGPVIFLRDFDARAVDRLSGQQLYNATMMACGLWGESTCSLPNIAPV